MSARMYDTDGTPLVRGRDGELVVADVEPKPIPDPCPDCRLRGGRQVVDCSLGGDQSGACREPPPTHRSNEH